MSHRERKQRSRFTNSMNRSRRTLECRKCHIWRIAICFVVQFYGAHGLITQQVHGGNLVSPNIYENVEAPDSSGLWAPTARTMTIFDASEFNEIPTGGAFLTEFNLRPDRDTEEGQQFGWERYALSFSVTPVEPENMSLVFDENFAADAAPVVVFDDKWIVTASEPDPNADVRPFEYRAQFETPFFYDPVDGNLLVEWIFEGELTTAGRLDRDKFNATPEAQGTIWAPSSSAPIATSRIFSVVTQFVYTIPGDFNHNDQLDVEDIDIFSAAIQNNANPLFDLNGDGSVDSADREHWILKLTNTWFGDSNLDGEFSSLDFVVVFQAGKFETGLDAGWSEGDWNGDGVFSSGDLVTAFQYGGYEQGQRAAVAHVPEPNGSVVLTIMLFGLVTITRRRSKSFSCSI